MALKKTHAQFRAVKAQWEIENRTIDGVHRWRDRRALHLCWWFIENVTAEDPARNDIFFELREIVREARV